MFNNVAIDVVIGLVFIYLLYSLFATILAEMVATALGLRSKNLKEAVDRMINDDEDLSFKKRVQNSLYIWKQPNNYRIKKFYNHPEIKYLGSKGLFRIPSDFKAISFSKTLLFILNGPGPLQKDRIEHALNDILKRHSTPRVGPFRNGKYRDKWAMSKNRTSLDKESCEYVISLWQDSANDLIKFKMQLEAWFDRTMEQSTEWYKRKIQVVLLIIGLFIAWFFNVNTFTIVERLSIDKDAREKLVELASTSLRKSKEDGLNSATPEGQEALIAKAESQLFSDIARSKMILGLQSWLPDSVFFYTQKGKHEKSISQELEIHNLHEKFQQKVQGQPSGYLYFDTWDKLYYLFTLLTDNFFGFLITAIAISLGAPFWFDLLNRLMQFRTSLKQDTNTPKSSQAISPKVSPLNRVG